MGELRDASTLRSQLKQSRRPAFARQAQTRVAVAREQYQSIDIHATLDRILAEVSEVAIDLQAVAAEPWYHDPVSLAKERNRQLGNNENRDNEFEQL